MLWVALPSNTPEGLRELAADHVLVNALGITEEEWKALDSIQLPGAASKDGYVQLLMVVRGIS